MITPGDVILALGSGLIGALGAQLLSIWHVRASEVRRVKLDVLRKIAGNRAALSVPPSVDHRERFFEGLNEVMVVFSDSKEVSKALIDFNTTLNVPNSPNSNERLIDLFKAICRDVDIDPSAFNDSLFLKPFRAGGQAVETPYR